jgi:16S rRNA (cytosine967-C5)-methyltransferase
MEFTEKLLIASNRIPSLVVRTNVLKLSRPQLLRRLGEEGVKGRPTPFSPQGVLLVGFRGRVDQLLSFKEGLFQVQDEAAQVASSLLCLQAEQTVLDICAGFGGKTTHMAELMDDRGQVIALDIRPRRLLSLKENMIRLGMKSISSVAADGSANLSYLFRSPFDRIMIDAPCSGLGVLSRHPDGKWNKSEEDILRLAELQKTMVSQAVPLLREGGNMLFVTCTLSREENEEVVSHCLGSHREMALVDLREQSPQWARSLIDEQGFLRTFPHQHHMDGFFAALFRRK